jgi:hypothetical protein
VVARLRERAGISAEICGRPKLAYSVWNKMRQKGLEIGGVFDVLGFRILVNDVSDCYAALGVVHGLWEPILDEFDDYIAKPKPNGYQSLHSAVIGPEGVTIEVQIRTFAMHRHADLGVAALLAVLQEGLPNRIAWSRGFLKSGERTPRGIDLIERFKQAAFHDRIYVLTPQGHIIDLPADATALDFAYAVHTEVGHRCRGAKVNGAMVPLTKTLASGQQVEILTAQGRRRLQPRISEDGLGAEFVAGSRNQDVNSQGAPCRAQHHAGLSEIASRTRQTFRRPSCSRRWAAAISAAHGSAMRLAASFLRKRRALRHHRLQRFRGLTCWYRARATF